MTQTDTTTVSAGQQLAMAEAAREVQLALRTELITAATKLWPLLDVNNLSKTWLPWQAAMSALITRFHAESGQAAAAYYRFARDAHTGSYFEPVLAPAPPQIQLTKTLGFSGPGTLTRYQGPPADASKTALVNVLGSSSRIVLNGSRQTIEDTVHADPEAVGWYFKTDPDPCYFCAMVASRGLVFKKTSFDQSNVRFIGDGHAKIHNHCGCMLAPAFSHDAVLPATNQRALDVYNSRGPGDSVKAFRKAWEAQRPAR